MINQTISFVLASERTTKTVLTTTTVSYIYSSTYIIFISVITYIIYILSVFAPIGLLLNCFNLIILSINLKWKNSAKFYYLVTTISNIFLAISFDVLKVLPIGVSYAFNSDILIDDYSPIFCSVHNYLTPICEFIWMWNVTTFAIKRCLIVCFPFKAIFISRIISWKVNIIQILLPFALWWIHLAYYKLFCYTWMNEQLCFCGNEATSYGYNQIPWTYYYEVFAYQYLTYFVPMLFIIFSEILLIYKLNIASIKRKKLIKKASGSKNESYDIRLNLIVICTSTIYIIIILPWCILAAFYQYILYLPDVASTFILIWFSSIYNFGIVFLRSCDVAILLFMVKDYWKLIRCKFL